MPQYKQVKEVCSLKEACLDGIAVNMTEFWCKHYGKNLSCPEQTIYLDSPFECLPECLLEEIIETLTEKELLQERHWSLLITSRLTKLDLSNISYDGTLLYDLISSRCKDTLKELRIFARKVPPGTLLNMLRALRKLDVLILYNSFNDDNICPILGACCPELREIDLSYFYWVHNNSLTDNGIRYLFMDNLPHYKYNPKIRRNLNREKNGNWKNKLLSLSCIRRTRNTEERYENGRMTSSGDIDRILNAESGCGRCKLITRLNIWNTDVTALGVEAALRHLPNLQYLNHPDLVSTIGEMHRADWEAGVPIPPYQLTSLFAGSERELLQDTKKKIWDKVSLSVAVYVCPSVTDVYLRFDSSRKCPVDVLVPLCMLKNLKSLDIRVIGNNYEKQKVSFSALIPVLLCCGQSMRVLKLSYVLGVDFGVIGINCPLMEDLEVLADKDFGGDNSVEELSSSSSCRRPFSQLKFLTVSNIWSLWNSSQVQVSADKRSCSDVPPWHWKQLLSSPVLETVCSHNSSVLTDGVLKEVLSQGQKFSRLRELRLEFSECFTSEFIRLLLHTTGPLKRILLQDCSCVTESDVTSLRALIEENNWDVIIDQWCSLDRWR